jgi:hypothetical protein
MSESENDGMTTLFHQTIIRDKQYNIRVLISSFPFSAGECFHNESQSVTVIPVKPPTPDAHLLTGCTYRVSDDMLSNDG